jgi:hypothetical protein
MGTRKQVFRIRAPIMLSNLAKRNGGFKATVELSKIKRDAAHENKRRSVGTLTILTQANMQKPKKKGFAGEIAGSPWVQIPPPIHHTTFTFKEVIFALY